MSSERVVEVVSGGGVGVVSEAGAVLSSEAAAVLEGEVSGDVRAVVSDRSGAVDSTAAGAGSGSAGMAGAVSSPHAHRIRMRAMMVRRMSTPDSTTSHATGCPRHRQLHGVQTCDRVWKSIYYNI